MQDRLKYRIWNKLTNSYTTGGCLKFGQMCFVSVETDEEEIETNIKPAEDQDNYIIEQCTGLKDKNGKLIFEGDLIKSPNNSHPLAVYHDITGLWRCKENRPNGIWELPLYDMVRNYTVEIIGNIHEPREEKQ